MDSRVAAAEGADEIRRLVNEWEEAKVEMEEGESKMNLAASELADLGVDPEDWVNPEEE